MSDFQAIRRTGTRNRPGTRRPAPAPRLERAAAALREHGFTVEVLDDAAAARARVNELIPAGRQRFHRGKRDPPLVRYRGGH